MKPKIAVNLYPNPGAQDGEILSLWEDFKYCGVIVMSHVRTEVAQDVRLYVYVDASEHVFADPCVRMQTYRGKFNRSDTGRDYACWIHVGTLQREDAIDLARDHLRMQTCTQ